MANKEELEKDVRQRHRDYLKARARYLRFVVGMGVRGIAQELGVSLSTVQSWTKQ